jgi:quinoprotein glucose dehydrogenase
MAHRRLWVGLVALAAACGSPPPPDLGDATPWSSYGADPGGSRHSGLTQINRENVHRLEVAWSYRTGDATHDDSSQGPKEGCGHCHTGASKFEATPVLADGRLVLSTPLNRVVALDPVTGRELWRHDPQIKLDLDRNEGFVSRGVAYWAARRDTSAGTGGSGACERRIFFGTVDARLLAMDAATGALCPGFGDSGTVHLDRGIGRVDEGQYGVTSPPAVVGDVVVVGSAIGDNRRVEIESGVVRAFDARSGALLWSWDPLPDIPNHTGAANAWAPLSADTAMGLVFVPTGSAAPDYYGGLRPGDNHYANSVVALEAATGKVRWSYQVVHHDLWDFDVAAQPSLITVPRDGRDVPAVAVATKMGHLFILDRTSGQPLFPVEERPVPPSDVPGEQAWPTQPFPVKPAPIHPSGFTRDMIWGRTAEERLACLAQFDRMTAGPVFTPPSLKGIIMYPGYAGGTVWGGMSYSPEQHLLVTNQLRLPFWVRLTARPEGETGGNQEGTPYTMSRAMLASPGGLPCSRPPWGTIVAVDVATGERRWEMPLGVHEDTVAGVAARIRGLPNLGGSIVTAGGLVFIAASNDDQIRALDLETGGELWRAHLPAGGQATPMTYAAKGRQYLVIAAGGHGNLGSTFGDYVVAFALPHR